MSNKKYRSSKDKSDKRINRSEKEGEGAKRKYPEDRDGEQGGLEGQEREMHEKILARHYEGGAEPSPEAFARALRQWNQLPGTVVRPPTDVRPPSKELSKSTNVSQASASTTTDAEDEKNKP